jgi:hypothetical protein
VDSVDHQVVLAPDQANVGAAYSAAATVPVLSVVSPFGLSSLAAPEPYVAGPGLPSSAVSGPAGTGSSNPQAKDTLVPAEVSPPSPVPATPVPAPVSDVPTSLGIEEPAFAGRIGPG